MVFLGVTEHPHDGICAGMLPVIVLLIDFTWIFSDALSAIATVVTPFRREESSLPWDRELSDMETPARYHVLSYLDMRRQQKECSGSLVRSRDEGYPMHLL
jgi:hypothetical protein